MFGKKYLLLELDAFEAEYYHLPQFVPYPQNEQKNLKKEGFNWESTVSAMRALIEEEDCDEYKLYKLFIRKWPLYEKLNQASKEKRYQDAEKVIDKILSIDLLDPSAYLNLGYVFRSQKEFYKAQQAYLKGLELVIYQVPFLAGLAKTYEGMAKLEDAIYIWNQIIDMASNEDEKKQEALTKLVQYKVYSQAGNGELEPDMNFERLMRKIFQQNYNDGEALTQLGVKLVHHQLNKLAVKVFERVYQLSQSKVSDFAVN